MTFTSQGGSMRRFPNDQRGIHQRLLRLDPRERLFIQAWCELFDTTVQFPFRNTPISFKAVTEELSKYEKSRFHGPLLRDELQARSSEPTLHDLAGNIDQLLKDPVRGARLLANAVSALGFHHEFLMHAYSVILAIEDQPFIDRLNYMVQWWLNNSEEACVHDRPGALEGPFHKRMALLL